MRNSSAANFELSIVLPLGVIANQLMKVESDLRFLNARTSAYASERAVVDFAGQAATPLEKIQEALETIRGLVADIETDIQPRATNARQLQARADRDD